MSLKVSNATFGEFPKLTGITPPVSQNTLPVQTQTVSQPVVADRMLQHPIMQNQPEKNVFRDNLSLINSGLVLISLGVAATAIVKGKNPKLIEETGSKLNEFSGRISEIASQVTNASEKITNAATKVDKMETKLGDVETQLAEVVTKANTTATKQEELLAQTNSRFEHIDNHVIAHDEQIGNLQGYQNHSGAFIERNISYIDGIPLTRNLANDGSVIDLPENVIKWLSEAADCFINKGAKQIKPKQLTKDSTIWSITSESIPEKEGGLGEVPVQIGKNLVKEFGIDNYIVRQMVQRPQMSQLVEKPGKQAIYRYNINSDKKFEMPVDKIAEFKMNVMRNGRYETQTVNVYSGVDPEFGHKRLMFQNDDYFNASGGIYKDSFMVSEPERFAFFNKAVYEFMKIKANPNSATTLKIHNEEAFNAVKMPDAMILNDWHAGGLAGLLRLKAPCEAGMGELSNSAAETFRTMNLININHNLGYQGFGGAHAADMLNTLFDKYAYDIYRYANTPFGFRGINKVLTIDGNANLAHMAACLSNVMKPVSPNYARELGAEFARSGSMQHLCNVRLNQGTMVGASNGWDRVLNEVSDAKKNSFVNAINSDKVAILIERLKQLDAVLEENVRKKLHEIIDAKDMNAVHLDEKIAKIKNLESPAIREALQEVLDSHFRIKELREIKTYTHEDTLDTIMTNRRHNKRMFIDYLNDMIEYTKNKGEKPFHIGEPQLTDLSHVRPEDLDDTIVYNMGVRFVSQKGVDVACDAIEKVLKDWETRYPNKPKPIFVIGGVDAENGNIKKFARELKQHLDPRFSRQVVWQDDFTKNNIWQAGSDFTLFASHFEPDGAKWESLYKGTPVVCTRVGGHVNSVNDGVNGFLTGRTIPQIKETLGLKDVTPEQLPVEERARYVAAMGDDFAAAIWRSVETYYNRDAYAQMVRASIDGNESWVIKDGNGKIIGGALLGHMKDLGFNLKDFPQIQLPQAA